MKYELDGEELKALGLTLRILGNQFAKGEGTPEALRMSAGNLRYAADILESAADDWDDNEADEGGSPA